MSCVIFVNPVLQIYAMLSTIVIYCASAAIFWPWRHIEVNITDIWAHLCLIVSGATLLRFAKDDETDVETLDRHISHYGIVWLFMVLPCAAIIIFLLVYESQSPQVAQHKRQEISWIVDANKRLGSLGDTEVQQFFVRLSQWDFTYLMRAQQVIHTELAGMRCRQGYASMKLRTIKELHVEKTELSMNNWLNDHPRSWPTSKKSLKKTDDDWMEEDGDAEVVRVQKPPGRPNSAPVQRTPLFVDAPVTLRVTAAESPQCSPHELEVQEVETMALPGQLTDDEDSLCTLSGEKLK